MGNKKLSIAAKFGNTKSRTVVLLFGVIFLVTVSIALTKLSSNKDPIAARASQTMAVPDSIRAIPGNKTPEKYRELQIIDNDRRAREAREKGGNRSAIPTIIHTDILKGTKGGFGLTGKETIHGEGPYGPYGVNADGTPFGMGPDGQPYTTKGYQIHGYGPNGPYGIGPDGKPFGIAPNGKPYGVGPDGKPILGLDKDGRPIIMGPNGKPMTGYGPNGEIILLGPDGQPMYDANGNMVGPDYTGPLFDANGNPIDPDYVAALRKLQAAGVFDYIPGGPKYSDALSANAGGYQIHGYGPNGPYGVDSQGNPFGIGPDGKPYDPAGPYAPEWYEPPTRSPGEEAQKRIEEERARVDKLREDRETRLANQRKKQENQRKVQLDDASVEAKSALMDGQAKALFDAWSSVIPQSHVMGTQFGPMVTAQREAQEFMRGAGPAVTATTTTEPAYREGDDVISSGAILYATIDTSVNSDEPGPVLATVVHGPYKGARVIGNFAPPTMTSEKLTVRFTNMVVPGSPLSLAIEAVGVDPDTARTAVSSDVDHHYLLRYGSLFASAFLEGYGSAVKEAGATRTENTDGTTSTSTTDLSGTEEVWAAMGTVGSSWGAAAAPLFATLPTITIDSGTGVGLLFMTDVNISQHLEKN